MVKRIQQNKLEKRLGNVTIEQTIASDDSLLPAPEELESYQRLNPDILPWLLNHAGKEQEHRHSIDNRKLHLMNKALNNDTAAILASFLIVIVFLGASVFLIYFDKDITGSIFGFCGIIGAYMLYKKIIARKQ